MYLDRIRSYVRREGRMTTRQKEAVEKHWPAYGLACSASLIDYDHVFQRQAPTVLEIGFGMGDSLLALVQRYPENNYIGVEVYRPGVGTFLANVHDAKLKNVRVFCDDAVEVLEQCIADESLDCVNIFFPDPWPKKRHHKRRLMRPEFVQLLAQKIKPAGYLHVATDWENYAEHIQGVLDPLAYFSEVDPVEEEGSLLDRPPSKYEKRGERLGHQIFDFYRKKK